MSDEQVLDPRIAAWLHDGPTTASDWVSRTVIDHARDHPRRAPVGVRWGSVLRDLLRGRPTAASRRLVIALAAVVLALALAGVGYLAWRQNVVVPPVPLPSPTASATPESAAPTAPTGVFACPPGADPEEPGPADQARPPYDPDWRARNNREWRAAVDAGSGVLVVAPAGEIWVFDLCTNTWRRTAATTLDGRVPVYDPGADLVVMLGSDRVTTFDAERDAATELGRTPVVGNWEAVYDSAAEAIVARDEVTSRVWTYQVATDEWREITQSGDTPPAADVECDIQLLGYDSSVERVWLVHDPGWCLDRSQDRSASTYELDLHSGSWQRLAIATPGFRAFDWGPPRMDVAYDEANGLSVVYEGLRLTAYDAAARSWQVVYTRPGINSRDGGLTHFRVPLAYDPINRRVVMVGGDPLARSGGSYEDWVTFGDITSIDLATRTWTELLAGIRLASPTAEPSSTTPIVESTVDAAGDASPGSEIDIVLVATSVADGMLTLEVTLAEEWPISIDGSDLLPVLFVEWVADDRPPPGSSGFGAACNPYVATYRSAIMPDGTVSGSLPLPAGQVADVGGPVLTLTVPLTAFKDPTTLGFALSTANEGGDRFPDDAGETLCHDIPLTPPD